jgi:hypothetical protein
VPAFLPVVNDGPFRISVVQIGDMKRLTGVADVVTEHAGRANEFVGVSVGGELAHFIEDLPNPEGQQATMLRRDRIAAENIVHTVVERLPFVGIDKGRAGGQAEKRVAIRVFLIHVGEMVWAFGRPGMPLLADAGFPESPVRRPWERTRRNPCP